MSSRPSAKSIPGLWSRAASLWGLFATLLLLLPAVAAEESDSDMNFRIVADLAPTERASDSTADHTKFQELQGPFASGPEVTRACLSCHTEAGQHFMKSLHWTWEFIHPKTGQKLGKKTLINTFCTNARGNEGMCAQCHAGYGWKETASTSPTRPTSTAWSATTAPAPTTRRPIPRATRPVR